MSVSQSQIPGRPSFRSAAVNAVAIVPLLSSGDEADGGGHSMRSFESLMRSLRRFAKKKVGDEPDTSPVMRRRGGLEECKAEAQSSGDSRRAEAWSDEASEILLVVPNAQLTRPGDWRYDSTPLRSHDWSSGCQRLRCFDGRPDKARMAHDRLSKPGSFVDLLPSRGTAAVIGVLNVRDCADTRVLHAAEAELQAWARRYAADPYGHSSLQNPTHPAHTVVHRIFLFDSFEDQSQKNVDLSQTTLGTSNLVAFPPSDAQHSHMMELHLNVVVNDLAVAIFRALETRIRASDAITRLVPRGGADSYFQFTSRTNSGAEHPAGPSSKLAITNLATIMGSTKTLNAAIAHDADTDDKTDSAEGPNASSRLKAVMGAAAASAVKALNKPAIPTSPLYQLLTPLDDAFDPAILTQKELEAISKRDIARREKFAADLSLLAGSPIDAYERFTHAAELAKSTHDPLWYAASLQGCAFAFIAMADIGGHGVDNYLENNFQLPEEIMSLALATQSATSTDGDRRRVTIDRTKTTMPAAVAALADEALSIFNRHVKLAPLYTELLLQLAWYTAELEEAHLRCRWGEGDSCYAGDTLSGEPRRWELTSVSQFDIDDLTKRGGTTALLSIDSLGRCQRFTDLLHRAVSNGALDPKTRVDAAVTCARLCLAGVKATQWRKSSHLSPHSRLRLPRKSAFFITIAAEAMAQCSGPEAQQRAASLWLAASHLYSSEGNGWNCSSNYAWATLRASTLQALSQQVNHVSAEVAAELLLVLLSEISPYNAGDLLLPSQYTTNEEGNLDTSKHSDQINPDSRHSDSNESTLFQTRTGETAADGMDGASLGKNAKNVRRTTAIQARGTFFVQAAPSSLTLAQSKWLEDGPVPAIQLPLVEHAAMISMNRDDSKAFARLKDLLPYSNLTSSLLFFHCVVPRVRFETCAIAQKRCIAYLSDLRQGAPTTSSVASIEAKVSKAGKVSVYGRNALEGSSAPPPLEVISARIVKSESHLLLERTKAAGFSVKAAVGMSMATFFNPYASKKKDETGGRAQATLVAEGEERTVVIEFGNLLSVPLEIPSCQLKFYSSLSVEIEAPPLSFTVPPQTKSFMVHFPFTVVASKWKPFVKQTAQAEVEPEVGDALNTVFDPNASFFELVGLRVACLNRSYFTAFARHENVTSTKKRSDAKLLLSFSKKQVPEPASVYQRSAHNTTQGTLDQLTLWMESVPAQPNLLVSFSTSQTPLEDAATVPVHLSDGEIYSIPPFRLENDFGPSGLGKMERMQIIGVGMPGLPEEILFDTDELAKALEEEEVNLSEMTSNGSSSEDFEELMESDGLPPLKMKCITEGLSLQRINDRHKSLGEGSIVTFQMAATHDMGNQLANGGNVRIRFRYRGPSPSPSVEIWRKREVSLRIVRVKGPRISSLTFRSDLSWGSSYKELCQSLARQKSETVSKWITTKPTNRTYSPTSGSNALVADKAISGSSVHDNTKYSFESNILNRVGVDKGVHVSGSEIVVLMAVANETSSTIVLSNRKGLVGGFEGSPMPTVRVTSGVSVKIPVVIPRIDRVDDNGDIVDIAAELISRTALQWESEIEDGAGNKKTRQGRVRIPSRCLREIIDEHQSFASRICKPPVLVKVKLERQGPDSDVKVSPGDTVNTFAEVYVQDWVHKDAVSKCSITVEFCCARKDSGRSSMSCDEENSTAFAWCGQLRRTVKADERTILHRARIVFFQKGVFVISACAKILRDGCIAEEVWWAPLAETLIVEKAKK